MVRTSGPDDLPTTDVSSTLEAGAAGVAMGRNIWGNDDPVHYAAAIAKLIHENCSVDAALKEMGKA